MNLRRLLLSLALLLGAAPALQAQQVDVIRGRVTGPDSLPLEDVVVTATSIGGNVSRTARTDRNGRFTITFPGGEGDYMMSYVMIGYVARRFEIKRNADEEILIADARLARIGGVLDPVNVRGARERVRRDEIAPDIGGSESGIAPAGVPIDQLGDLAAMAASLPGVQLVPGQDGGPDGYSVLGLGADQNNATLNGMSFDGSGVPRDANISSGLATSPYDVSRGGFSGGQFTMRTRPGTNFRVRGMSLNLDAPQLQWTDRAARMLGQEYANLSLGGTASGPIAPDRAFYNLSYQLGRRSSDYYNLLNTGPLGLQTAGVAADSVTRLRDILSDARVPLGAGSVGDSRLSDQGNVLGSIDVTPPGSTSGQAYNLTFNGSWGRTSPVGGGATELPGFGGTRTNWRGGLQGRHSGYFGIGILSESSAGLSATQSYSDPFLSLPAGRVRVRSDFADGASGVQMLSFGGSPTLDVSQRTTSASFMNQLSWFSANNTHRLKLTSELRHEGLDQDQTTNRLGTFTFNSLADLEAGAPSAFTRQLSARRRESGQLVTGLSLGDAWRAKPDLQVQYGVRLDGNRFLDTPERNPEIEELFGVRNDRVPNRLYLSPRAGFSWTYGTAAQIAGFQGAMRGPRAVVRGGIGMFQNMPGPNLVIPALDQTGLAGGQQQIGCVGSATPVPDWEGYGSGVPIPDRCADGTTGTVFANASPSVTLFSEDFSAPRSLRSNLQWSGPVLNNRFSTTVDATWSLNRAQQSMVDLNFNPTERFVLPDEDGRPVYVETSSIVPATGSVASRGSRVTEDFARVLEMRSDLHSVSRQLSVRLSPVRYSTNINWSLSYVLADVRERTRGFTSTAGNPLAIEWARSPMNSRHQINYNIGYNLFDAVRLNWFGSVRSGTPFTPLVAGDINGDGYANDRAFVFDPDAAADPALAASMRSLLDNGSGVARECLASQRGRLAARNSCEGPWTTTSTLSMSLNPVKFRMPQRATLSLQLSNPLGAADLLLHGSDGLRGWGQPSMPDQALLYVRGFDPTEQRYRYDVNQRFGSTSTSGMFRMPVTLTALMRFDLGPMRERQLLTSQLDRGRRSEGTKVPEQLLRAMYGSGGIVNPMATILRQQDSLGLTPAQADSIATLNRWYSVRVDSIWAPVVSYLANLPDSYSEQAAYDRYLSARRASVDLLSDLGPQVKGLLTPTQRRKLPPMVASHLEPRYLASIRSGTATFTSNPAGMMAAGAVPFGGMMPAGGGNITIIRQQ